jgi:hypothetical protein
MDRLLGRGRGDGGGRSRAHRRGDFSVVPGVRGEIRADSRYVAWCAICDWNVDPETPHQERDRLDRARRALSRRHGEKLLAEVTAGGSLRARRDASSLLAFAIAFAVHGLTVALAFGGVWWLVRGWGGMGMVLGLLLLVVAWPFGPRAARLPKADPVLHRDDAPELYALVDEVARVVGTAVSTRSGSTRRSRRAS